METYVDITPFIWTLIRNVVILSYDDVKETPEFVKVYQLIEEDDGDHIYYVTIDNTVISSSDLNELFDKILYFLRIKSNDESYREMFILFQKAMSIFSTHSQIDDIASVLKNVNM